MKNKTCKLLAVILTVFNQSASAQNPLALLEKWAAENPIEKIYLHFDRESYLAGETAWFKAYLSCDYLPDTISTTLYVELLDTGGSGIIRKILPVLMSVSYGQFELPDSLATGAYTIRAFTPAMQETAPDFVYTKRLHIYGKKNAANATASKIHLDFFPEGGHLVTGFSNNVAFKAVFDNGYPSPVKGVIKNSRGQQITTLTDYHDGMGLFELLPQAGEKYYAVTTLGNFPLPEPTEKAITVNVMPDPQGFFYEVQQKTDDPAFMAAYMVGQMQHRAVFSQELKLAASIQGVVNTQNLRSGILQITFFNKQGMPLAERLWFINNKEYIQPAEILTDTIDFRARARNRFYISLADTIQANISVSLADADYENQVREENIISSFLLTNDIRGYVHNPAWYLTAENDSVKTAIDLLMMTHGWRRFKWTELVQQISERRNHSGYITLAGKATLRGTNRPFDNKSVILMINNLGDKKKRSTHMLETDKGGNFLIDSLIFFDRNMLVFSDVRGKKSQYIDVLLKADSLNKKFYWQGFKLMPGFTTVKKDTSWQMDYDAMQKEKGLLLQGITVNVKRKTPLQEVDERYTRGIFSGDATKAIDLVNNEDALPYNNIFDYLQNRVNGLQINTDGAEYSVFYRQGPTLSSMGNIPMTIFLDEIETDASIIAAIPANQVALVKVYNTFTGAWGNAPGGVLSVYTKKADDLKNTGKANTIVYNGYSVVKEFYAPDYKIAAKNDKTDNRITLDWRPDIFINNVNPRIPIGFYNNDRTKKFKIIVEGMTLSGKLICLEKMISNMK